MQAGHGCKLALRAWTLGVVTVAGLAGALGLAVMAAAPAVAATGPASATASGGSVITTGPTTFPPPGAPCVELDKLVFNETGTGTYSATDGTNTAAYTNGPVTLTLNLDPTPPFAYSGPLGTFGYKSDCSVPAGTPLHVKATTMGTSGSDSVSCTYAGTFSRTNPTGGNGTDTAMANLSGTCTVTKGGVTATSPTNEVRTIAYIGGSCLGRPPTECKDNVTVGATATQGDPGTPGAGSTNGAGTATNGAATPANGATTPTGAGSSGGLLAGTGFDVVASVLVAIVLIAAGYTLVMVRGRQSRR